MRKFIVLFFVLIGFTALKAYSQGIYDIIVKIDEFNEPIRMHKVRTYIKADEKSGFIVIDTNGQPKDSLFIGMKYNLGTEDHPVNIAGTTYGYETLYVCGRDIEPEELLVFVFRTVTSRNGQTYYGKIAWLERRDGTKTCFMEN